MCVFLKPFRRDGEILSYIKCGLCRECRLSVSRDWIVRAHCHSLIYGKPKYFVLYTYNKDYCPLSYRLNYKHIQDFHKRWRKTGAFFSFLGCREYGEEKKRPHYHMLYWTEVDNLDLFQDSTCRRTDYRSRFLEKLWGKGYVFVQTVGNLDTIVQYCSCYISKNKSQKVQDIAYSYSDEVVLPADIVVSGIKTIIAPDAYTGAMVSSKQVVPRTKTGRSQFLQALKSGWERVHSSQGLGSAWLDDWRNVHTYVLQGAKMYINGYEYNIPKSWEDKLYEKYRLESCIIGDYVRLRKQNSLDFLERLNSCDKFRKQVEREKVARSQEVLRKKCKEFSKTGEIYLTSFDD